MKIIVFLLLVIVAAGILFWNDIFTDEPAEEARPTPALPKKVVLPESKPSSDPAPKKTESNYKAMMAQGNWKGALKILTSEDLGIQNLTKLYHMHQCLVKLKKNQEADKVLHRILKEAPTSKETVLAVLNGLEEGAWSALEGRKRLSRVQGVFGALDPRSCARLVKAVRKINESLPGSIQGLFVSEKYTVVPNDNLWNICKKYDRTLPFNTESGLICHLNKIKADKIYPGQTLTIPKERVRIKIWRNNWLLAVFLGDTLLSLYPVGLGANDSTPVGKFTIARRLKDPDWYSEKLGRLVPYGDPANVLGSRWLGFESKENARGLGIHGTWEPESIGKNFSSGCIRLINDDVEELFEIVSRGTEVELL
jgi:nucleoid-associated protein YgaU